jgi:catechol 2,3-dioxygenase-like lactoylglutathione lyase family enzyme
LTPQKTRRNLTQTLYLRLEKYLKMKPRISMITLGVRDFARAVAFYEEGLGFPRMESPPEVAFFTLNGTWLGLYGREALAEDAKVSSEGSGFGAFTLAHNVPSEAEVDEVMAQAERAGATIVKPPEKVFWGGYSGYFADPDGHLWEVAYNPHFWVGPEDE